MRVLTLYQQYHAHINPLSEHDDEQLIPGSTHLGYCNPPCKTNTNPPAGGGPTDNPQGTTGGYEAAFIPPVLLFYLLQTILHPHLLDLVGWPSVWCLLVSPKSTNSRWLLFLTKWLQTR